MSIRKEITTLPRILFLDIETSPNLATVWNIWNQNISVSQLIESSYVLCWSAKWKDSKEVMFDSVKKSGKEGVVKSIWQLLNSASVIIHYNGRRFDIPTLNKEFLLLGLNPPSHYHQIDLYQTVKKKFKFVSNKLAYITKQLGFEGKIKTTHQLWLDCMANKTKAWKLMEEYNRRDVTELEKVYYKLLPWIETHPNLGIYINSDVPVCTNCGKKHITKKGFYYTKTQVYQRYQCQDCGTHLKSRVAEKQKNKNSLLIQICD